MKPIEGIIIAMATPMKPDESLDLGLVKPLVDKLIADGASGIFAAGTMGECAYLTMEEKVQLAQATVKAVNGRVPVVMGTGAPTTREVVETNARLKDSGVDLLSVVLPYYFKPNQQEIYRHYATIIAKSTIPVMAYNIPKFTGTSMEAETVRRLWQTDGLIGIKDSSGDADVTRSYLDATDRTFKVISGTDALIFKGLCMGACAAISAPSNVLTKIPCRIFDLHKAGDQKGAAGAQADWDAVTGILAATGTFPGTIKLAMSHFTLPIGNCRAPILPANAMLLEATMPQLKAYRDKYYG